MKKACFISILTAACSVPSGDFVEYDCAPDGGVIADAAIDDGGTTSCAPQLAHSGVGPDGVWESAPVFQDDAAWIPYPSRVTITLEHNLGYVPRVPLVYLSFHSDGSNFVSSSGDLALIVHMDETLITIHNGTNGDFFARVTCQ